jgi:16S rRNA processing protein RimM
LLHKPSTSVSGAIPADLTPVGHIFGAYGVDGWIRIKPYSADAQTLLNVKTWWLDKPSMHDVDRLQVKLHGGDVVAQLQGVVGRDAADALKGAVVHIGRSRFPALGSNEYYWSDLIGLAVENLQGESLGQVNDMMDNGAHPILRVVAADAANEKQPERLIPFVAQFIINVDQSGKKITVDWGCDY